jgi:hypothetical protein
LAEQLSLDCDQEGQKLRNEVDEVRLTIGGSEIGRTRFLNVRRTASVTQEKNRRTGFGGSFVCPSGVVTGDSESPNCAAECVELVAADTGMIIRKAQPSIIRL